MGYSLSVLIASVVALLSRTPTDEALSPRTSSTPAAGSVCTYSVHREPGAPPLGSADAAREMVLGAESVVLVRVLGAEAPRQERRRFYPPVAAVVVEVRRVLRGSAPPDTFRVEGNLRDDDLGERKADDFSTNTGYCLGSFYRRFGFHLLLLRRNDRGELAPYWYGLGPSNREVRGLFDPWLLWVQDVIRNPSAPLGPMRAANDSVVPVFAPWLGWPARGVFLQGELQDTRGRPVPHARLLASGFAVAHTTSDGSFDFSWPSGYGATLELQCEDRRGRVVSHTLGPLEPSVTTVKREFNFSVRPRLPAIPSGLCRQGEEAQGPRVIEAAWTAALDSVRFAICRGFPATFGPVSPRIDSLVMTEIRRRVDRDRADSNTSIRVRLRGVVQVAGSGNGEWRPPFAFRAHEVLDAEVSKPACSER
jgi:hypothetical protein